MAALIKCQQPDWGVLSMVGPIIRFYMRKHLLAPKISLLGGSDPYVSFSERDVQTARMIRFGQSLGISLKDIAEVHDKMQADGLTCERTVDIMDDQLARLERQAQLDRQWPDGS